MRNLPRRLTPSMRRSAISARKTERSGWPIVRSQKTRASWIVAPMMALRNWRAVYSTSGNSGISSLTIFFQPRSRAGTGHIQNEIRKSTEIRLYTPPRCAYRPTTWRSSSTTFSNSSAAELAEDAPSANCSFTCVVTLMAVESFWLLEVW